MNMQHATTVLVVHLKLELDRRNTCSMLKSYNLFLIFALSGHWCTLHPVSKNVQPMACYNFNTHILIFWQKCYLSRQSKDALMCHLKLLVLLHYLAKRGNTKITFLTQSAAAAPALCLPERKIVILMCLIASTLLR